MVFKVVKKKKRTLLGAAKAVLCRSLVLPLMFDPPFQVRNFNLIPFHLRGHSEIEKRPTL